MPDRPEAANATGWLLVLLAVWRRVRRLDKVSTPALLRRMSEPVDSRAGPRARWTAVAGLGLAAALLTVAVITGETRNAAIFGIAGPALLIGLLAAFALRLGGASGTLRPGSAALLRMAAANGARHRSRSILSATLVAAASFMIVTVAAFHQDFSSERLGSTIVAHMRGKATSRMSTEEILALTREAS